MRIQNKYRVKKKIKLKDGTVLSYDRKTRNNNAVVLINKKGNPIATRVTEPIPLKLKKKQFAKFISLSPGLV